MSTLLLVRHGQASYGQPDYDRLSERGEAQARTLGGHLGARLKPDALYVGPLRRQRDTARLMCEAAPSWPGAVELAGLVEYDAESVLRRALPALLDHDPELKTLFEGMDDPRRAELVFQRVMRHWLDGRVDPAAGTWHDFASGAAGALREIMRREGRGKTVVVVTSAGPISIGLQLALQLPDAIALKMSWVVANSSVTELRWREDEVTLISFNTVPHLPETQVTYR